MGEKTWVFSYHEIFTGNTVIGRKTITKTPPPKENMALKCESNVDLHPVLLLIWVLLVKLTRKSFIWYIYSTCISVGIWGRQWERRGLKCSKHGCCTKIMLLWLNTVIAPHPSPVCIQIWHLWVSFCFWGCKPDCRRN